MKIEIPKPTVDIEEIRRLYHEASEAGTREKKKKNHGAKGDGAETAAETAPARS